MKTVKQMVAMLIFAVLIIVPNAVRAADWGCEVLLCLANPAGPMAASYCVPPILRLFASLLKPFPDPFPQCGMAQGQSGKSWAQTDTMYYNQCPPGLTAAPAGQYVVMSQILPAQVTGVFSNFDQVAGVGIGEGVGLSPYNEEGDNRGVPPKPCVSDYLGTGIILRAPDDDGAIYQVEAAYYRNVVILDSVINPRAINVFIDDKLYRVVRY